MTSQGQETLLKSTVLVTVFGDFTTAGRPAALLVLVLGKRGKREAFLGDLLPSNGSAILIFPSTSNFIVGSVSLLSRTLKQTPTFLD